MNKPSVIIGNTILNYNSGKVTGEFIDIEGERFYKITNAQNMPLFFMSLVSNSDHWLYISSNGGLSAGRKNPDNALFPYYTDDKITSFSHETGNLTIIFIQKGNKTFLWEPFSSSNDIQYKITRNLYKSITGNKLIFEEINHNLEISYQYGWYNSEKFGFIKKSVLTNLGKNNVLIEMLDGIQNILPYGITRIFQNLFSNLANAYKKNELVKPENIGIYYLSSIPTDKAEPSEGLKASIAWQTGIDNPILLISSQQIINFRKGLNIKEETDIRASCGAYLASTNFKIATNEQKKWNIIVELNQDIADIKKIRKIIQSGHNLEKCIDDDIKNGTKYLKHFVGNADGFQFTSNEDLCSRHLSNVLYNIMRGGIFADNYIIYKSDFLKFLENTNKAVYAHFNSLFKKLQNSFSIHQLLKIAEETKNPDFIRISYEYLPITFSRRHGDPSRPWNLFSIETKNSDGSRRLYYEGNWRDIFQNWEALCFSFPEFIENIICKFTNATTVDGYNPYRITSNGIDWEVPDPHDPWSNIGYWGDHQIIYFQKLLELSYNFHPGKLQKFLMKEIFTYANIPYRIKPFQSLYSNPYSTIEFDYKLNKAILKKVSKAGSDGKLLCLKNNEIYKVTLTEKLLLLLLVKISNYVPEGGIWMNTQRPEWNDANNALVGNGLSMVTLYYIRRFVCFFIEIINSCKVPDFNVSAEICSFFNGINKTLQEQKKYLGPGFNNVQKLQFLTKVGIAGSNYRNNIYNTGFSGIKHKLSKAQLIEFLELFSHYLNQSIRVNKRPDNLYHSYNIMRLEDDRLEVQHLYEMLEGQVAILSSGYADSKEVIEIMHNLNKSKIFRTDQNSYMLYPDRQLKKFLEKNILPKEAVQKSVLLQKLIRDENKNIIIKDEDGELHFNSSFRNITDLEKALNNLKNSNYKNLVKNEIELIINLFEEVFNHKFFTGRSGTFYAYEGLGCIYWHMVSKLLLALQENYYKAIDNNEPAAIVEKLKSFYYKVKVGLGIKKNPDEYGAFPIDPYSHTPGDGGVKQPGMTGQVKEDILSRFGELGLRIKNGEIHFH
ncbi:MAG: hypothetical protein JXB17_01390, partial [Bacteroidales bacterium]|nr:hypothetical protein [Bacteroidales bacterium]